MDCGIIAVWGKGGAGKTTVAASLAVEIAGRGSLVGVISADTSYAPIQHILGTEIKKEKSLATLIKELDDEAARYFTESAAHRNVFVMALSEQDNCMTVSGIDEPDAKRLLSIAKERFDCLIVDCTPNVRDTLTFLGLFQSARIVEIVYSSVAGYKFRLSHQTFLEEMAFLGKMLTVVNFDRGMMDLQQIEKALKTKLRFVLPYSKSVPAAECDGETLSSKNVKSLKDGKYLKTIKKLADELAKNG